MGYHPNGAVAALTLGNGRGFSQALNARQQVASRSYLGGFTHTLSYDANGRVVGIDDATDNAHDRTYGDDDLGRLISAAGPWGNATYTYDALGNLRQRVLGARTVTTEYNAQNRVSRFRDTALGGNVWQTVSHDARGNMTVTGQTALGRPGLTYDRANQPVTISGSVTGSFTYDGNLKRVKQVMAGKTVYSVYGL